NRWSLISGMGGRHFPDSVADLIRNTQLIAKTSQGNPRMMNTLCRGALLDAATRGEQVVDISHVERAWVEVNG
ncbi:hypothetical protein QTN31_16915, partial [Alicyclobacillus cycloheptanicus]